jgi:hypothetical protein
MEMEKMILLLCLFIMISGSGVSAITIDGSASDWNATYLHADPVDRPSNMVEVINWGACVDNGNLYGFNEIAPLGTNSHTIEWVAGSTTDVRRLYSALWIDMDRSDATLLGGNTHQAPADGGPWPGLGNAGIDVNFEWGMRSDFQSTRKYYFWGTGDNVDNAGPEWETFGAPSHDTTAPITHEFTDYATEWVCSVSAIKSAVANFPDGVVPKKVWKLAQGSQGYDGVGGSYLNYGYDLTATVYLPVETIWGDTNEDLTTDIVDLSTLATNYGATGQTGDTWAMGDFNADGEIGIEDLSILASYYGQTYGGAEVPEPVSLILLGLGSLCIARRK